MAGGGNFDGGCRTSSSLSCAAKPAAPHSASAPSAVGTASAGGTLAAASWPAATAAACGGLVTAAQGSAPRGTGTRTAERSRLPAIAAGSTAAAAAKIAALLESSAGAAAAHPEQHGEVGAPDAGAKAGGATNSQPDAAASAGAEEDGEHGDPRPSLHASLAARTDHQLRPLPKHVLAPGTRDAARRDAFAAGAAGDWRARWTAGVGEQLAGARSRSRTSGY